METSPIYWANVISFVGLVVLLIWAVFILFFDDKPK